MTAPTAAARPSHPYADLVERHGLGASHGLILELVPSGARVLDVGCSAGYLAAELAARGCSVMGFEVDAAAAARAGEHCTEVVVGSIESADDRARVEGPFDAIVMGDVLEHLLDPGAALRAMHPLLAAGGVVVASIPNVVSWPARLSIARGAFDYADHGIFDRTHLRFFTRRSVHELARAAGFAVEAERFAPVERPPGRLRRAFPVASDVAYKTLMRAWPELLAQQFVIRLRATAGPEGRPEVSS